MIVDSATGAVRGDLAAVWPWVVDTEPAGIGEDQLLALETRLSLRLPEDFRIYLRDWCPPETNPYEQIDDFDTTWWPLARLATVEAEYSNPIQMPEVAAAPDKYLFFADSGAWCWAWAICCDDGPNRGRIAVFSGRDRYVADSFGAFLDLYLIDPWSLY